MKAKIIWSSSSKWILPWPQEGLAYQTNASIEYDCI